MKNNLKNLGFYMWCFNLAIVSGLTFRNILYSSMDASTLAWMLLLPLAVALLLFAIGKAVGGRYGESVAAGQALGQKNTVFAIWMAYTFLTPVTAIAGGFYSVWHNIFNSYQLYKKRKQHP